MDTRSSCPQAAGNGLVAGHAARRVPNISLHSLVDQIVLGLRGRSVGLVPRARNGWPSWKGRPIIFGDWRAALVGYRASTFTAPRRLPLFLSCFPVGALRHKFLDSARGKMSCPPMPSPDSPVRRTESPGSERPEWDFKYSTSAQRSSSLSLQPIIPRPEPSSNEWPELLFPTSDVSKRNDPDLPEVSTPTFIGSNSRPT
jgi:hypothetical protein